MSKPIKRSAALIPLSREHHHGLLLSWKIREGLKKNIEIERIKSYINWFWKQHLQAHFEFEENFVFPILGLENELIIRVLQEHKNLEQLFAAKEAVKKNVSLIQEELVAHIRFEEKILFKEIERIASEEQLKSIEKEYSELSVAAWEDEFWKTK